VVINWKAAFPQRHHLYSSASAARLKVKRQGSNLLITSGAFGDAAEKVNFLAMLSLMN
jgi:hypothetical protein